MDQLLFYKQFWLSQSATSRCGSPLPTPSPSALNHTSSSYSSGWDVFSTVEDRSCMCSDSHPSCATRAWVSHSNHASQHKAALPFCIAAAAVRSGNLFVLQRLRRHRLVLVHPDTGEFLASRARHIYTSGSRKDRGISNIEDYYVMGLA